MKKLMSGFFAAALVLALPLTANAQEAVTPDDQEECRATIAPIQSGEKVAATATFDSPFGKIASLEAPVESNLALYTEDDGERTEMAVEDEERPLGAEEPIGAEEPVGVEERPIGAERDQLAAENQSEFWLVAKDVPAGTYEVTLENEDGKTCTTEITVQDDTALETDIGADVDADVDADVEVDEEENVDW